MLSGFKSFLIILSLHLVNCAIAVERPNILWLTCEDNNVSWIGCYGNPVAKTPNIDQLAKDGFQYMNCYANVPVCAPQRATWITGVHALSMGTHEMRSRYQIPHDKIPYYPDILKAAGYFVSNHTKTDYNIAGRDDKEPWDSSEKYAWREREPGKPFFCIINTTLSHEGSSRGKLKETESDPDQMILKPYHPDLPEIRQNYAMYMDGITRMDKAIGEAIAELKKDGLLEETIIIYNSDHGGVMVRSKRFLFNSGIHCPLVIRIPEKFRQYWPADEPGQKVHDLVGFIDMIPTWLDIAGADVPAHMQGKIFLGENKQKRDLHFAYRSRMDEKYDSQRAVHDGRFLYIKNYMPWVPWGQHLYYLWGQPAVRSWEAHHLAGKTNEVTGRFFGPKPVEELYDTLADPHCIKNLADAITQAERLNVFRKALRDWQLEIHDSGMLPEQMRVIRAEQNDMTIYDMVRNPVLYDLPAYLDAADLALQGDPANIDKLKQLMHSPDAGLRYWGIIGAMRLGSRAGDLKSDVIELLDDPSGEVSAYAAWTAFQMGNEDQGLAGLRKLLREHSPATLTILNIIDHMKESGFSLREDIGNLEPEKVAQSNYVKRMQEYLAEKFSSPEHITLND